MSSAINKGINGGDLSAIAYALIPCLYIGCGLWWGKIPDVINPFLNIGGVEHIANAVQAPTDILNHGVEAAKGITVDRGTR